MIFIPPKRRFNPELIHRLNQAADIVAEDLAEHFVRHRHIGLAADVIAKLRLDHAEGAFDVGPLVIVPQELLAVEGEVVEHLLPEPARCPAVDALERNIRRGPMLGNDIHVVDAGIALIGRHFPHIEVRGRGVDEVGEQLRITRVLLPNFHRRDHVGFDAAHQMDLHPVMLLPHHAILVIKPADKARGGEARGIHSKIDFHGFEWQAALGDQARRIGVSIGLSK